MKSFQRIALACGLGLMTVTTVSATEPPPPKSGDALWHAPPPPPYQPQSKLVAMPDFVPGYGRLFVSPKSLPSGPFLGYNRKGQLVNVIYMLPVNAFGNRKDFSDLPMPVPKARVDHVSVTYVGPHPGIEEPHYHVTLWLISKAEQKSLD